MLSLRKNKSLVESASALNAGIESDPILLGNLEMAWNKYELERRVWYRFVIEILFSVKYKTHIGDIIRTYIVCILGIFFWNFQNRVGSTLFSEDIFEMTAFPIIPEVAIDFCVLNDNVSQSVWQSSSRSVEQLVTQPLRVSDLKSCDPVSITLFFFRVIYNMAILNGCLYK